MKVLYDTLKDLDKLEGHPSREVVWNPKGVLLLVVVAIKVWRAAQTTSSCGGTGDDSRVPTTTIATYVLTRQHAVDPSCLIIRIIAWKIFSLALACRSWTLSSRPPPGA